MMLFAQYLPSALSKSCNMLSAKTRAGGTLRLFFPHVVGCSRLERCSFWWGGVYRPSLGVCNFSGVSDSDTRVESVHVWWRWHDLLTHPVLDLLFFCGSPSWLRCRFQGSNIMARSGNLDTAFSVDEASVKEAVVAHLSFLCLQC